jgi:hypothetical protein
MEMTMKFMTQHRPRLPVEDYSVPLRNAVSWLGKRYLLAEPVKAHPVDHRPPRYFGERTHQNERLGTEELRLDH